MNNKVYTGIRVPQPPGMKKRLLIADDDEGLRDIFRMIFEKEDYEVDIFENAGELMKMNFKFPDLFLIDRLLSGVDGLDLCRFLKNNWNTRHIPVIMISATPDIALQSRLAGADAFVEKPFQMAYLLKVVKEQLAKKR